MPGRDGEGGPKVGAGYLRSIEAMDRLRETLRDEHCFYIQFIYAVWRQCLTPFQAANLHIQVTLTPCPINNTSTLFGSI